MTIAGIVLIAVTIGIAALTIWNLRRDAIARAMTDATNLGALMADQNARLIQATDLVLQETRQLVLAAGVETPAQFRRLMATKAVHARLVDELRKLPQAEAISLIDDEGNVVNYSRTWPVPPINTLHREFFEALRDGDPLGTFVGLPFRNSTDGTWDLPIELRINGPDGRFLGLVNMMVAARYFEDLYKQLVTSEGESIALFRTDGTMLARYPHIERMMGGKLPPSAPWYRAQGKQGTYRNEDSIDGRPRIISAHPLDNWPLVVFVTTQESVALADWRRQSILIAIGAACSVLGLLVFLWALRAQLRRLAWSETALAEQNAALQSGRAEVELAAEALRASEARFRGFATTSSDWFWETDAEHHITYMSEGISTTGFGIRPAQMLGRTRAELAAAADREPELWQRHLAALGRHEPFRDFTYTWNNQGGIGTASINGDPIFDDDGSFLGYRGTGRDVTHQIRAESHMREAKEAAEAANHAKSQFLANISHELRTPLNAIIGFSEMIEQGIAGPISPQQQEYMQLVLQSGQHLLSVINDILDLARADSGKFELFDEAGLNLREVAAATIALMRHKSEAGGVYLSSTCTDDLPRLTADSTRLKQILLNLISNAVRFTGPGGSVTVSAHTTADGGIAFAVTDTGVGMTEDEVQIALEPFGQVDARLSREHEGTGLGLPLARRLAELHGGSLRIESKKGTGTRVVVTLPASRVCREELAIAG
ncbi:MAG TPA: ATP-binding protein [Stellaceae bacterium]